MKKIIFISIVFLGAILIPSITYSQENEIPIKEVNEDDLGNVTDEFQEKFFEALKQKGIENYEKAISALEDCREIEPQNPVVFFELGKNYKALENYEKAVEHLEKARELAPQRQVILAELYNTHTLAENYDEAIASVKELIEMDDSFTEDLANLYMLNEQYNEALEVLDEMDRQLGSNTYRNTMRRQIYARTKNTDAQIENLEKGIARDPGNEQNYLNLIYIHSEQGNDEEAYETAQELLENYPGSNLVHLALYKFYLDRDDPEAAVNSMKIVFASEEIDLESKYKVLNDFLNFVSENPEWEEDLMGLSKSLAEHEDAPKLYEQLGQYYLRNNRKEDALNYLEVGIKANPENFELTKTTLLLQIEFGNLKAAEELSEDALEIFPAQPLLYLLRGVVLNQIEAFSEAEEILNFGRDYLFDNPKMEIDFYQQLALSYKGQGKAEKASEFEEKAEKLLKELN